MLKPSELLAGAPAASEPIPVYTGPTRTGAALIAAVAVDAERQTPPRKKKSHLAAKKPDAAAEPNTAAKETGKDAGKDAKKDAKSDTPAKPAAARHASAKPDAAPKAAETPVAAADKPPAKPAKPRAAAKPPAKPAPKSTTGEANPADQKPTAAPRT
jgi:D-alanyl-D-alanine carboxypeptidase